MLKFGLTQIVTTPTRFGLNVASILDLIFTNSKYILDCGSWSIRISDHEPFYVIRKKKRIPPERTTFTCRNFHDYQKEEFQLDLCDFNWDDYFLVTNPNEAWDFLYNAIKQVADVHCPFKTFSSKVRPSWLNNEILEHLKERDLYIKLSRTSTILLNGPN